ncbi:hypothetical protein Poly24_38510 [Rosistilla carotiformis]|uniref:Uncharacterized protein n=1 Tax=Rosistilla carotiformis TaxID=2528017 RepID=A0A518JX65_9BACT|nr:hypothetical protein [Rosistilla carotiformis]QDV70132.1 hypothetical protein Poly24_38510 [Rosistilla carotiformis]
MSELPRMSVKSLRDLIADTETTLKDLNTELQRREIAAQEMEIEHLEDHMKHAQLSLQSIRDFLAILVNEYRSRH